jgi:hypothetical protein
VPQHSSNTRLVMCALFVRMSQKKHLYTSFYREQVKSRFFVVVTVV